MKTINQIAKELGVSKQTIRNAIAKLGLQRNLQKNGNTFAIDENQEMLIRQEFLQTSKGGEQSKETQTLRGSLHSALRLLEKQNEQLSGELEIKNKQIADLSAALERTTESLTESLQAAQALHAGTIQKQLTDGGADQPQHDEPTRKKKRGWFGRK